MSLKFLILTFCLPMSWAATAPEPAGVDERFKTLDALMVEVRTMTAQMELLVKSAEPALKTVKMADSKELASQAQQRLLQKCSADFSIDTIAKHKTPPLIYGTKSPLGGMLDGIRGYYECEAFVQRKPDICEALSGYQSWEVEEVHDIQGRRFYGSKVKTTNKPDDFLIYCKNHYKRFLMIQLLAAGRPDAAKFCEKTFSFSSEELGGNSLQEECAWMATKEPSPECRKPISSSIGESEIKACLDHYVINADENTCPEITTDVPLLSKESRALHRSACQEVSAYRKAYREKDVRHCGDSLLCRMLMGEKVCGRYLDKFKPEYCRSWTRENLHDAVAILFAEQQTFRKRGSEVIEMLKQRRAQVEELFKQINDRLEGFEPKSEAGYVSRRKAYWDLRRKFEQPANKKKTPSQTPVRRDQTPK